MDDDGHYILAGLRPCQREIHDKSDQKQITCPSMENRERRPRPEVTFFIGTVEEPYDCFRASQI